METIIITHETQDLDKLIRDWENSILDNKVKSLREDWKYFKHKRDVQIQRLHMLLDTNAEEPRIDRCYEIIKKYQKQMSLMMDAIKVYILAYEVFDKNEY